MPMLDTRQFRDLLGTFITDLVIGILAYVAESERDRIRSRQAQGIAAAKAKGMTFGRKYIPRPNNFADVYALWKDGNCTAVQAMTHLRLKKTTFYEMVNRYEAEMIVPPLPTANQSQALPQLPTRKE
jgi:DNA invertase Pin-like site-specific DNA recombinase